MTKLPLLAVIGILLVVSAPAALAQEAMPMTGDMGMMPGAQMADTMMKMHDQMMEMCEPMMAMDASMTSMCARMMPMTDTMMQMHDEMMKMQDMMMQGGGMTMPMEPTMSMPEM